MRLLFRAGHSAWPSSEWSSNTLPESSSSSKPESWGGGRWPRMISSIPWSREFNDWENIALFLYVGAAILLQISLEISSVPQFNLIYTFFLLTKSTKKPSKVWHLLLKLLKNHIQLPNGLSILLKRIFIELESLETLVWQKPWEENKYFIKRHVCPLHRISLISKSAQLNLLNKN